MSDRPNHSLADAILRLQKLPLDPYLRDKVEEAWDLFTDGHQIEAEALAENVEARVRESDEAPAPTSPSRARQRL